MILFILSGLDCCLHRNIQMHVFQCLTFIDNERSEKSATDMLQDQKSSEEKNKEEVELIELLIVLFCS